ncbi:phage DNA methylase [Thioalkalivibrio nitratireducens DSM 14787]|uniref:Phage DNA methylase n=1 Tax=Thioalkalivibrio nitratireducens (strain DSM 14787 / UNIQEM 213 / ALEN2) TaxID=1255043 RepID=L0DRZ4_THIND|nr:phage DNA methylase [Thioalkalivibrio nitratireducens]AGA31757.1 phage DNA methylase [Thioalkalivibrio nitratireducens DSM 14787]
MGGYFGSKATVGLCQSIIALMPPHDTYIETHLGGGAIMQRKPAALRNIGIDLDPQALREFAGPYPIEKVNACAHAFLAGFDFQGRELVYSDPPYLHATRTSRRRYRFEYQEADHLELLALLQSLPCSVILSGYPSALYDEHLTGWRSLEVQVMIQGRVPHRETLVQLHARSGALAALCGARTSPTGNGSSARPRAGASATGPCPRRSAWRCSRP